MQRQLALPLPGDRADGLGPTQRRVMIGAIVALHGAAVWGLLQVREVREAVVQAAPIFVDLIAPPAPPKSVPAPPAQAPQPIRKKPPPIAAAPAPAPFVAPLPPAPEPLPPGVTPAAVAAPPAAVATPPTSPALAPAPLPTPALAPAPKDIPTSAVQYLDAPVLVYPPLSLRRREAGRVLVRVYIDTAGLPREVQVSASSGHARLDEAAIAAVRKARFKPYSEGGRPTAGWALIPLNFELEQ